MWYRALILSRVLTFAEAPIPLLTGIDRGSQRNWHTTTPRGFPGDRAGALSLGGPCCDIPPPVSDSTATCQSCYTRSCTCKSLVNYSVDYFFSRQLRNTGRAQPPRRGAEIQFHYDMCVLVAHKEESKGEWLDSGDNLTPDRGSGASKVSGKCSLLNSNAMELILIR